ncbi:hypothetical protein Acr_13g0001630 [Actinidia rufa]|uniref:Uncharacterized protein n=1 Tax=Actinidia rufa TaxID=165716 RepID=A0A7J0FJ95_9ERIC|nr:hypothetical protein Acr_13g0001630 [Actinidia rufa]
MCFGGKADHPHYLALSKNKKEVRATIRPLNSSLRTLLRCPWGRGSPDFHRSLVRPPNENGGPCAGVSSLRLACSVWSAPWFLECQPQRGMPSTRALLATNHSLAGRSGSAFQVGYPNRLLRSTGSLAPSSILSTALLLGSLLLQPLAVIACLLARVARTWVVRLSQSGLSSRPMFPGARVKA